MVEAIALLLGLSLGFFAAKALLASKASSKDEQLSRQTQDLEALRLECAKLLAETREIAERASAAEADKKTALARIDELKADNEKNIKLMREQFGSTALEVMEKERVNLRADHAKESTGVLEPLRKEIERLQGEVQKSREEEGKARVAMEKNLKDMTVANQSLSLEADTLSKALRSQVKLQGNWGEKQLYTMLESCGLRDGHEWFKQGIGLNIKFAGDRAAYPDAVVILEGDRYLIIDSKVSLENFLKYIAAESSNDQAACDLAKKALADNIRSHVDDLSKKDYANQQGVHAGSPVMMYFHIEGALSLALAADPDLHSYAQKKKIYFCGPSTLMGLMRALDMIWIEQKQNKNTLAIADIGAKMYDQVAEVVAKIERAKKATSDAMAFQDDALKRMSSGNDNMVRLSEKMKALGTKASKEIPPTLVIEAQQNDIPAEHPFLSQRN